MVKSTTTSSSRTFPFNVPVTATSVLPAPSLIEVGSTVSAIWVLVASSSAIAMAFVVNTSPTATLMYIDPCATTASSSMGVKVNVVVPAESPAGMTSGGPKDSV